MLHSLTKVVSTVLFVVILGGCAQLGPELMKGGRNDYNQVLAQSDDEEVLLNLVRLRYADSPVFLNVASVSTSFSWSQGLSAEGLRFQPESADTRVGVRGSLDYSERPTITYTPLGGADFVKNVLTPMELDLMLLLSRSGWSLERLLRLTVNRINGVENAATASGPTPWEAPEYQEFQRIARLLRSIQKKGMLTLGYRNLGEKTLVSLRIEPAFQDQPEARELGRLLGIDPAQGLITVDNSSRLRRADTIGLEMRSLGGIMFFLSQGIEVPKKDLVAKRVTVTREADGKPFDWSLILGDLFVVHSQDEPPENAAVAVRYRGSWFYIDDTDMQSKYTFMLLGQLSALQAGDIERAGPILTLPVTGS